MLFLPNHNAPSRSRWRALPHMIKRLLTIFFAAVSSFGAFCQQNDLEGFEKFLGDEKVEALNMLEESFDEFLESNFPIQPTENEKIKQLLQIIKETGEFEENWKFNSTFNLQVIRKVESSGLRKEFWTYNYEEYIPYYYHQYLIDSIKNENPDTILRIDSNQIQRIYNSDEEILIIENPDSIDGMSYKEWSDSLLDFNWRGQFTFAIDKFSINDSVILEYLDAKEATGNISPSLIASGLLYRDPDLSEPFVKRIILMELYYFMIKWNLENKKTTR